MAQNPDLILFVGDIIDSQIEDSGYEMDVESRGFPLL